MRKGTAMNTVKDRYQSEVEDNYAKVTNRLYDVNGLDSHARDIFAYILAQGFGWKSSRNDTEPLIASIHKLRSEVIGCR